MNASKHNINQRTRVLLVSAALVACFGTASAQLTWDPAQNGSGSGGAGHWHGTNNWYDGSANVTWSNGNDATLDGTGGNVNFTSGGDGAAVSAGHLHFGVSGYTIGMGGGNGRNMTITGISGESATFTDAGGWNPRLTLNTSVDNTWSGTIGTGNHGFTLTGGGSLTFSGNMRAMEGVIINNGTLRAGGTVTTGQGNSITINSGGVLDVVDQTWTFNNFWNRNANLTLNDGGIVGFSILDDDNSGRLFGTAGDGAANMTFDGLFSLDTTGFTQTEGQWNLVGLSGTATYGSTFGLEFDGGGAFSDNGNGTYSSGNWTFDTSNGNLTVIPEPSTLLLVGLFGLAVVALRRHGSK